MIFGLNREARKRFAARRARNGGIVERVAQINMSGREVLKGKTEEAEETIHENDVPNAMARKIPASEAVRFDVEYY